MANTFIHGKLSTIQFGGTYFAALTVKYSEGLSDLSDVTYTQSGGATWQIMLPGYSKASGSLTFVYDTLNQPVLSPQSQIAGALMSMIFSPDGTKLFTFSAYSEGFDIPGGPQVKGPVVCTTNWQSTGVVTRPTS